MYKKMLVMAALMSFAGIASAEFYPYVGGSMGLVVNSTDSGEVNGVAGYFRGIPFNVFLGAAGITSQGIYFGGELTGTFATAEITNSNGLKTTYGYGASLIPGILLSENTLAFVRAGVVRSSFTNVSEMSTGGQFGLGLETALTQAMNVRGEYDFTAYRTAATVGAPRSDAFMLGLIYKLS